MHTLEVVCSPHQGKPLSATADQKALPALVCPQYTNRCDVDKDGPGREGVRPALHHQDPRQGGGRQFVVSVLSARNGLFDRGGQGVAWDMLPRL